MSKLEQIKSLAKTRGIFYPSSEIYGGISGTYDYGTNGTLLKRRLENLWRSFFLGLDPNFLEIEPVNIMPEKVFIASGHLKNFVDPVTKCKKCETKYRADHVLGDILKENYEGLSAVKMDNLIKKHKIRYKGIFKARNCSGSVYKFLKRIQYTKKILAFGSSDSWKGL